MGNLQVRFLEGWAPAMAPGYSTIEGRAQFHDYGVNQAVRISREFIFTMVVHRLLYLRSQLTV
jgi:hypothetical protein